jgi:hypothetical protein
MTTIAFYFFVALFIYLLVSFLLFSKKHINQVLRALKKHTG